MNSNLGAQVARSRQEQDSTYAIPEDQWDILVMTRKDSHEYSLCIVRNSADVEVVHVPLSSLNDNQRCGERWYTLG